MTVKINEMDYLLDSLGTFWKSLPTNDQLSLMNMWRGYAQITADLYGQLYQHDYNKSLNDIQINYLRLWRQYKLWKNYDLDYAPSFSDQGLAATTLTYQTTGENIFCDLRYKGSWDKKYLDLVSEANQYHNLYWQAQITPLEDGPGGLIGYFNSENTDLTDSISFGWENGSVFAMIGSTAGTIHKVQSGQVLSNNQTYTITGMYLASGGNLDVKVYDSASSVVSRLILDIDPPSFPVSGIYTVSPSASGASGVYFEVDTFGISNINFKNYIDDLNFISGTESTAEIEMLGYMDPTVDEKVQSIPTMQSELEEPVLTLTHGATGNYLLIDHALHFYDIMPAAYLWANKTYYDNDAIQDNFGSMVRYNKLDTVHTDTEYLNGVKGLWHSYLFGPTINNLETGLAILAKEPFAIHAGTISSITQDQADDTSALPPFTLQSGVITNIYTTSDTTYGYIDIADSGGTTRTYFYNLTAGLTSNSSTGAQWAIGDTVPAYSTLGQLNPGYLTIISDTGQVTTYEFATYIGLAINPRTKVMFAVGDEVDKFQVFTDALQVVDYKNDPDWWTEHLLLTSSYDYRIQRFKSFGVKLKPLYMTSNSLSLMAGSFINHIKPSDTRVWFLRYNDEPLFVVGSYDHINYVNASILGDQNIYLPGEFIYEDSNQAYLYGQGVVSQTSSPGSSPAYGDVPVVSISAPSAYVPSNTPTGQQKPAAAPGSILYGYYDALYVSDDSGDTWTRCTENDGVTPQVINVGRNVFVGSAEVLGINLNAVLGVNSTQVVAQSFVDTQSLGTAQAIPIPGTMDMYVGSDSVVSPIGASLGTLTASVSGPLNALQIYADGKFIFAGIKDTDRTKIATHLVTIDVDPNETIDETGSALYTLTMGAPNYAQISQNFILEGSAPNGITVEEISLTPKSWGSYPTDELTLSLYQGHYDGTGVFSPTLIQSVSLGTIPSASTKNFDQVTFSTPLSAGNYCLVVSRANAATWSGYYLINLVGITHMTPAEASAADVKVGMDVLGGNPRYMPNSQNYFFRSKIIAPLTINEYFTLDLKSSIDVGVTNMVENLQPNICVCYISGQRWKMMMTERGSNVIRKFLTSNDGGTWSQENITVSSMPTSGVTRTVFMEDGNDYMYVMFRIGIEEFVTVGKKTSGVYNWSVPTRIAGAEIKFNDQVYPSMVYEGGSIRLIAVTDTNRMLTYTINAT